MSVPVSERPAVYVQQQLLRLAVRAAGSAADGAAAQGQAAGQRRKTHLQGQVEEDTEPVLPPPSLVTWLRDVLGGGP